MRDELRQAVDRIAAETGFSGVVRVDRGDDVLLAEAFGLAHRAFEIPNTVDTRFGTASGTKGFTALTVMSLVQDGTLDLATTARSLLGDDLPLIDDRVTVEHLLAHRSGIGDYFDEEIERPITDHVLTVPVHELATIESHLRVLDGFPSKFAPGERFSYCNGGYVVLALARGACVRHAVPRVGGATRVRPRTDARHGVPPFRRAPGSDGDRIPRRGRRSDQRVPSRRYAGLGTAASTRPRPTSPRSGPPSSTAASCRRIS